MTKIEEAREFAKQLDKNEPMYSHIKVNEIISVYESAYKELEFDRNQCNLLLTKMMEYVNAEEQKAKTLIKVVR